MVAEAEFRKWLEAFLPKRYGVTPGYVISTGIPNTERAPHFDMIIYDKLDSPVLWVEDQPDASSQGRSLAIPVEHVKSVLEVKSAFSSATVKAAADHLGDLSPLMGGPDGLSERYKVHLPPSFCCGMVFFDLRGDAQFDATALGRIIPCIQYRGFFGGLILRGEGHVDQMSARISVLRSETAIEGTIEPDKESLLKGSPMSQSIKVADNLHFGSMLMWSESAFSQFAFDLIALMQGTYKSGYVSSFYGLGSS